MCSSHALVALLLRWAFAPKRHGGFDRDADRLSAKGLLGALIEKVGDQSLTVFLHDAKLGEDGWARGARPFVVPFSNGGLQVRGLLASKHFARSGLRKVWPCEAVAEGCGAPVLKFTELLYRAHLQDASLNYMF